MLSFDATNTIGSIFPRDFSSDTRMTEWLITLESFERLTAHKIFCVKIEIVAFLAAKPQLATTKTLYRILVWGFKQLVFKTRHKRWSALMTANPCFACKCY